MIGLTRRERVSDSHPVRPVLHRGAVDLTDLERALLALERDWWRDGASRAEAARRRLGLAAADHARLIGALIDRSDAEAHDPVLVRRLRRMRDARRSERAGRRVA